MITSQTVMYVWSLHFPCNILLRAVRVHVSQVTLPIAKCEGIAGPRTFGTCPRFSMLTDGLLHLVSWWLVWSRNLCRKCKERGLSHVDRYIYILNIPKMLGNSWWYSGTIIKQKKSFVVWQVLMLEDLHIGLSENDRTPLNLMIIHHMFFFWLSLFTKPFLGYTSFSKTSI